MQTVENPLITICKKKHPVTGLAVVILPVSQSIDTLTGSIDLIIQHLCSDFIFILKLHEFSVQIHKQFCFGVAVLICFLC